MFETYTDIFNERGKLYHQAMMEYPLARQKEFELVVDMLDLSPGLVLCDVPSGGGYLENFINTPNLKLYSVETSAEFAASTDSLCDNTTILCSTISSIPLENAVLDRVLSLAGLHHVDQQSSFYCEAHRILKDDGILVLADVWAGSGVDRFLNGFVDQHSSMGHKGDFLTEKTLKELEASGFRILSNQKQAYTWQFSSAEAMAQYCKKLFGINQAELSTILQGIEINLGYEVTEAGCFMNWELYFVKAAKASLVD